MIIDIEGIPGAGKTYWVEEKRLQYPNAHIFYEHTSENIIDFTRKAFMSFEEFDLFIERMKAECKLVYGDEYESHGLKKIYSNMLIWKQYKILSLFEIGYTDKKLNDEIIGLTRYEITGGRVDFNKYQQMVLALFEQIEQIEHKTECFLFEGSFFQNILFDIIGFYCLNDKEIILFYEKLSVMVRNASLKIKMIKVDDVEKCICQAASERTHNSPLWIDNFSQWVNCSLYGRNCNLSGVRGVIEFCEELQRTMLMVCDSGLFDVEIINWRE